MLQTVSQLSVSHQSALQLLQLAESYAAERQLSIAACVVDAHGRVKAQLVMDGASIIADELVVKKARTALLGLSSAEFAEAVSSAPAVEKSMLSLSSMTLLGGGYPLKTSEGLIVGAFAVGGASIDDDMACAEAALAALA